MKYKKKMNEKKKTARKTKRNGEKEGKWKKEKASCHNFRLESKPPKLHGKEIRFHLQMKKLRTSAKDEMLTNQRRTEGRLMEEFQDKALEPGLG